MSLTRGGDTHAGITDAVLPRDDKRRDISQPAWL